MKETKNYLAEVKLSDKIVEIGVDCTVSSTMTFNLSSYIERSISNKLAQDGYLSKYGEVEKVKAKLFMLKINSGKLEKNYLKEIDIVLQQARMSLQAYNKEIDKLFFDIHPAIKSFIEEKAYDTGHSSGYEECYNIAKDLLCDFRELFKNLGLNIMANKPI